MACLTVLAFKETTQREESIVRMAVILRYLSGLGSAQLNVDRLQASDLSLDGVLS